MVGHTGNWEAALQAVEATDRAIAQVSEQAWGCGYDVFLTADHGNVEMMRDPITQDIHTAHTLFPVPFFAMRADGKKTTLRSDGDLSQVAPTILESMGLDKPVEMTAASLIT